MAIRAGAKTNHGISAAMIDLIFQSNRAGGVQHFLIAMTADAAGVGHAAILMRCSIYSGGFLIIMCTDLHQIVDVTVTASTGIGGITFFCAAGRSDHLAVAMRMGSRQWSRVSWVSRLGNRISRLGNRISRLGRGLCRRIIRCICARRLGLVCGCCSGIIAAGT